MSNLKGDMSKGAPHVKARKLLTSSHLGLEKGVGNTHLFPTRLQGEAGCEHTGLWEWVGQTRNDHHILFLGHFSKQGRHTSVISCCHLSLRDQGPVWPLLSARGTSSKSFYLPAPPGPQLKRERTQGDLPEVPSNP